AIGALDRLDRRNHAERTVELSALRHGVQVGPRPYARRGGGVAEEIPGVVHLRLEAGLLEPGAGDRVRLVLLRRVAGPVRTRPSADRVEPLQAFERAHRATLPPPVVTEPEVRRTEPRDTRQRPGLANFG